jgi:dihydrofolate reductase
MGKLIATTQATVDGVIDPVGEWVQPDGDHGGYSFERQAKSSGLVLGRKTYEGLAGYWPSQTGNWADMVNAMPKYVASNNPVRRSQVERDPAQRGPRGLDPQTEGRGQR